MNIIDKVKEFFYIGEHKPKTAAAVEVFISDKLIEYTTGLILRTDMIKSQLETIETAKTLPKPEKTRVLISVYLELEKFIIEHEPLIVKRKFTKNELRNDIREKLRTFGADLDLLLAEDINQVSILCKIMCNLILNQISTLLGQTAAQRFIAKLSKSIVFKGILPGQDFKPEDIISSFKDELAELYNAVANTIGIKKTKSIFGESYKRLEAEYGFIPYTLEILKILPLGILEEEKIKASSKLELEEKVRERTKELEEYSKKLEEKVQERTKELAAANEELNASNEELNAANEELNASNEELKSTNEELQKTQDELVKEKESLQKFTKLATGRELEMVKLKQEVNSLLSELGRSEKYTK